MVAITDSDFLQHVAASVPVSDFDGYFYEKPGISSGLIENDIGLGLNTNTDIIDDQDQPETEDVCAPCCENSGRDLGRQCDDCVCLPPPKLSNSILKTLTG